MNIDKRTTGIHEEKTDHHPIPFQNQLYKPQIFICKLVVDPLKRGKKKGKGPVDRVWYL
jgi:hypothetical protein